MARIVKFTQVESDLRRLHPTEVECGYRSYEVDGRRFLQLDTYGSAARRGTGTSQSLQLDEEAAAKLMGLLQKAFPQLAVEAPRSVWQRLWAQVSGVVKRSHR